MIEKIQRIKAEIEALKVSKSEDLENIRIKYLSKKGEISQLFNDFRTVAAEQKREVGKQLNELKTLATERINALKSEFEDTHSESQNIDLTRTAYPIPLGSRHPLSLVKNEICDIFARLGFSIAEGPEIEDDWHVFSALNFAEDHPARDMQDTFFIQRSPDILLRTHTSSVQTRTMEHSQPPIRIICPGRVYRNEAISYRAHCFFHQVEAAKYLSTLPYVDGNRIGIWGWSYGGYNTLMSMSEGTPIFKAGVAVAAPTDWRFYDSVYTERFMRTPKENMEGYNAASAINRANKLNGELLLIHGTADDNVHLRNNAEYSEALVQADKQFDMQIYTNRNHGISGGNTTKHLLTRVANFFIDNLK